MMNRIGMALAGVIFGIALSLLVPVAFGIGSSTGNLPSSLNACSNGGCFLTGTTTAASAVSLTSGASAVAVASAVITPGDWDCDGVADYTPGATTSITNLSQGISTASNVFSAQDSYSSYSTAANVPTSGVPDTALRTPTVRTQLNSSTTVYLVSKATFTVSTLKGYGTINCRRRQ